MTRIVEPLEDKVSITEDEQLADVTQVGNEPEQQTLDLQEETQEQKSELPEKYQNKSIEDIVRMHQEAEKVLGRQSSEVGELRKVVDDFIKAKSQEVTQSPATQESDEDVDFYTDPNVAVNKAVSNNDDIKELKEFAEQTKQQQVLAQINAKYPDLQQIVQDQAFVEWVTSSTIRTELFQRAEKNFDFAAADELLGSWKERQGVVAKTQEMQEEDKKKQRKAASTGNVKGSGEPATRKIYRRADIVNLMINDPERYKANVDEFDRAYREGRVK
jgi:hypothetical protein